MVFIVIHMIVVINIMSVIIMKLQILKNLKIKLVMEVFYPQIIVLFVKGFHVKLVNVVMEFVVMMNHVMIVLVIADHVLVVVMEFVQKMKKIVLIV